MPDGLPSTRRSPSPSTFSRDGDGQAASEQSERSAPRTRRRRLRDLLLSSDQGYSLEEIERILEAKRGVILADLEHLRLSFRHQGATLLMAPPACQTCGYVFRLDVPKAPSKCPVCKSRKLADPVFKAQAEA